MTTALYKHCLDVYLAMMKDAVEEEVDGKPVLVWTGKGTHLFRELDLATPMYSITMQKLRAMSCLLQLQRGGGGSPSKWILITEPTPEIFNASKDRFHGKPTVREITNQRLSDLTHRLIEQENFFSLQYEMLRTQVEALAQEVYKLKCLTAPMKKPNDAPSAKNQES